MTKNQDHMDRNNYFLFLEFLFLDFLFLQFLFLAPPLTQLPWLDPNTAFIPTTSIDLTPPPTRVDTVVSIPHPIPTYHTPSPHPDLHPTLSCPCHRPSLS